METQYLGNIWQDHNCLQLDSNMSEKAASNLVRFPNPLAFGSQAGTLYTCNHIKTLLVLYLWHQVFMNSFH